MNNNNSNFIGYMAQDQYGNTFHIGNSPPRKWLLNYLGRKHADKMYMDDSSTGQPRHIGYIIGGHWLLIYKVFRFK